MVSIVSVAVTALKLARRDGGEIALGAHGELQAPGAEIKAATRSTAGVKSSGQAGGKAKNKE
jgi:hypothetical protein